MKTVGNLRYKYYSIKITPYLTINQVGVITVIFILNNSSTIIQYNGAVSDPTSFINYFITTTYIISSTAGFRFRLKLGWDKSSFSMNTMKMTLLMKNPQTNSGQYLADNEKDPHQRSD